MAAQRGETLTPDVKPLVKYIGIPELLRQIGRQEIASNLNPDDILTAWTPEQMEELIRRYQQTRQNNP